MRLVTYEAGAGPRPGVLEGGDVLDAWELLGAPDRGGLRELLEQDLVEPLRARLRSADADRPRIPDAKVLSPIPDPEKIVCIGLNYARHVAEAGQEAPGQPAIFGKYGNALRSSGEEVVLPAASEQIDYEAEIAFVVGRRARNVSEEDALDHVAGYMLFNDLSARDLQFATPQWMAGKVFDGSAPCGPWLVTPDEAGAPDALEFMLSLNGELMQAARTDDLIFDIPSLVSHLSTLMTLTPGDIVATGTPQGVGSARRPPVWLKDGDVVVISSPTLGELVTPIVRESGI